MKSLLWATLCLAVSFNQDTFAHSYSPGGVSESGRYFVQDQEKEDEKKQDDKEEKKEEKRKPDALDPDYEASVILSKNSWELDRYQLEIRNVLASKAFADRVSRRIGYRVDPIKVFKNWKKSHPKMNITQAALQLAVLEVGAKSALNMDSRICNIIEPHADDMASGPYMSHAGSGYRFRQTMDLPDYSSVRENVGMSYPYRATLMEYARNCANGWVNSGGHNANMVSQRKGSCNTFTISKHDGRAYCVGIYAD